MKTQMKQRTMDYAQFCEEIFRRLREDEELDLNNVRMTLFTNGSTCQCPEDCRLMRRLNRQYYQSKSDVVRGDWTIVYKNDGTVCEIPLTQLYQLHRHLDGDMKLVWYEICNALNDCNESMRYKWLGGLWDYERRREHLSMRIMSCRTDDYAGCIGFMHGDVAVILYDNSESNPECARVQQDCLGYWCQNETDVLRETFKHMLDEYAPDIDMALNGDASDFDYANLQQYTDIYKPIVISNEQGVDGAVALYYPGVQQAISAMISCGDFYSIMPTFEKALVYPASRVTEQQVRDRLREILRETPEGKIFSRQVCYYDSKRNSLEVI